jgi:hypothetical protein
MKWVSKKPYYPFKDERSGEKEKRGWGCNETHCTGGRGGRRQKRSCSEDYQAVPARPSGKRRQVARYNVLKWRTSGSVQRMEEAKYLDSISCFEGSIIMKYKPHTFSSYRAVNALRPGYKNQSCNALYGNNRCLFYDPHKTRKYTLWAEFWIL